VKEGKKAIDGKEMLIRGRRFFCGKDLLTRVFNPLRIDSRTTDRGWTRRSSVISGFERISSHTPGSYEELLAKGG